VECGTDRLRTRNPHRSEFELAENRLTDNRYVDNSVRQHNYMLSALYAIARPSVRYTGVSYKNVEVRDYEIFNIR